MTRKIDCTSEGVVGSTRKLPRAVPGAATGPQHLHPSHPPPASSSATGQKLLQVKHESRRGGARKEIRGVLERKLQGAWTASCCARRCTSPGVKNAKKSILNWITCPRFTSGAVSVDASFMNHLGALICVCLSKQNWIATCFHLGICDISLANIPLVPWGDVFSSSFQLWFSKMSPLSDGPGAG